jgi:asparagine synthase (glutamine-hydrolysing)
LVRGIEAVPPSAWDRVGDAVDRVVPPSRRGVITGNSVHKLASVLDLAGIDQVYSRLVSTWTNPNDVVIDGCEPLPSWSGIDAPLPEPAHRMMLFDLVSYLPDDILVKVDRASMGTSLEARTPYLDHRVVEFAWRLPFDLKIRNGEGKWLLRRVLERHVPKAMFERPKHGFGVPIDAWLRGPLREWAEDLLSRDRLSREGFLRPAPIRSVLREHLDGRRNYQYRLWAVLMFQSWLEAQDNSVLAD